MSGFKISKETMRKQRATSEAVRATARQVKNVITAHRSERMGKSDIARKIANDPTDVNEIARITYCVRQMMKFGEISLSPTSKGGTVGYWSIPKVTARFEPTYKKPEADTEEEEVVEKDTAQIIEVHNTPKDSPKAKVQNTSAPLIHDVKHTAKKEAPKQEIVAPAIELDGKPVNITITFNIR